MDTNQQMLVEQRLANDKKSTLIAYLLLIFLGWFGAHRFYLGQTGTAIAQLILMIGGTVLTVVLIGIPMLAIGGVWLLVDLFLIPGLVERDTANRREALRHEIGGSDPSTSSSSPPALSGA